MKILSWIRNKCNGKQDINKPNSVSMSYSDSFHRPNCNEEFSDWPNGLFAIGTFGNTSLKYGQDYPEGLGVGTRSNSLEKLSECSGEAGDEETDKDDDDELERQKSACSVVQMGAGKDVQTDKKKSGISRKSLSFLLKKVLLCRGGFLPVNPVVKDPNLDNSRMEKILKAMLHKKIYPQRHNSYPTSRKYLDMPKTESDNEDCEEESNKSKWVKTDSEYIVLEI